MRDPLLRPLPHREIQRTNTALLVIDMERDFLDAGAVQETPGGRRLIPIINQLSRWARRHALPVIFTREMHRATDRD
jgi:biuret amidohydrolase